jgi:type VI secretion system protein
MKLVLEIVSPPAGCEPSKVFGEQGGRIGRAPECDWVLASPYVSRHHATVSCTGGTYYIESTGENGVAINDVQTLLQPQEYRELRNGDTIYIDEFEIRVVLAEAAPPPAPVLDHVDSSLALETNRDDLDPLRRLGAGAPLPGSGAGLSMAGPASWNHSPSVADHFRPPAPAVTSLPVAEDWNQTSFDRAPLSETPAPQPQSQSVSPPLRETLAPQHESVPPAPMPRSGDGAAFDLTAVLQQLGVDPAELSPQTADACAAIVESVLQGVIDVLRARTQFKSQLRLPAVRVRSTRNNPLDFAINAQAALGALLDDANPAYLPPAEAFAETFRDMRGHELATLAGIRAGVQSLTRMFDPKTLQDRFDGELRHAGFLPITAKLRYWQLYADFYEQLQGDADGAFQRQFGQAFAEAYARQLAALNKD